MQCLAYTTKSLYGFRLRWECLCLYSNYVSSTKIAELEVSDPPNLSEIGRNEYI